MKKTNLFIFFCVLIFSTGCHTSKKIASNITENIKTSGQYNEATTTETYSFVDTTKKSGLKIKHYKIEFYPPTGPSKPDETIPDNPIFHFGINNNTEGSNPKSKPPNVGAIKSIEGYTIKATDEQTGINEETSNITTNKDAEINTDITRTAKVTEQPAPDPYSWRYILGICIIVALAGIGLYFGLRKTKVVIAIVTFFKKIFV